MPAMDIFRKPVVCTLPGMDAVEVRREIAYRTLADGTPLTMDVYRPPGLLESERRPGVVLVHGGPVPAEKWHLVKDWGVFTSYGRLLAASGLVAVAFNHRYLEMHRIEDAAGNWTTTSAAARSSPARSTS